MNVELVGSATTRSIGGRLVKFSSARHVKLK